MKRAITQGIKVQQQLRNKIAQAAGFKDHAEAVDTLDNRKMQKQANREALVNAIIEATKPEKTGTFCFDGFSWSPDGTRLALMGDHGTPDFTLAFAMGGKVTVIPVGNESWTMTVNSTFKDFTKLVDDILATMTVIQIRRTGGGF